MIEKAARAIAKSLGDDLDLAFLSKSSWTHAKGIAVDGSFRDVNAPLRSDYFDAASAVMDAICEPADTRLGFKIVADPSVPLGTIKVCHPDGRVETVRCNYP